jgi:hypothetical protein
MRGDLCGGQRKHHLLLLLLPLVLCKTPQCG